MILINKNKDNKFNKIPDKRTSLVLHKNKNSMRINKDKANSNILEKIVEKNEDKKDEVNNEQETKLKNDYKRAYSLSLLSVKDNKN